MGFCYHIAGVTCDNCRGTPTIVPPLREPRQFPVNVPGFTPGFNLPDSRIDRLKADMAAVAKEVSDRRAGRGVARAALDLLIALGADVPERAKEAAKKLRDALTEVR